MNEIIPAIIPQNLKIIKETFTKVSGSAKKAQIDIIDGEYAPPKTWPFNGNQFEEMIQFVRGEEKFPLIDEFDFEIDMLTFHPVEYITDFISMGAKSFIIHIDSTDHAKECIEAAKNSGCEAGIGIKPSIDSSLLEQYLPMVDFVQFMGNDRVGYNGVELDESVIAKISEFNKRHPSVPIQIDIGVSRETIPLLRKAGVSRFASESAIFNSPDPRQAIKELESL
jgi:ribulose-phosphate 3-epimerase